MAEYIDRYTLAKNICKAICGRDAGLCVAEPKDCSWKEMRAVFETPAADVAPVVHGRWIISPSEIPVIDTQQCSVCGQGMSERNQFWNSNYCPNCGAKMDKEEPNGR